VITERQQEEVMNWYAREKMADSTRSELEKQVDVRRQTSPRRRKAEFWLLAVLRTWIISATR
jgi:hypothetical protein